MSSIPFDIMMIIHSIVIALVIYLILKFAIGQPAVVARRNSIWVGIFALIYMLVFGHRLPRFSM